jgi:hypothetical protein
MYASFDLIDGETRDWILELYADDFKLYGAHCEADSMSAPR